MALIHQPSIAYTHQGTADRSLSPTELTVSSICRRLFGIQSLKTKNQNQFNCATDISILAKTIGIRFNAKWSHIMKNKMNSLMIKLGGPKLNQLQQLQDLFGDMSIGQLEKLIQLLEKHNCKVIGINADDSKENLMLWQISKHGTFLEKQIIPKDGPKSIDGILKRIDDIVTTKTKVTRCREKLTDKEKAEWWADRFRLDNELGMIISEVEMEWLEGSKCLMNPGYFDDFEDEDRDIDEDEDDNDNDNDNDSHDTNGDIKFGRRGPEEIVLLIDTRLECIPWECVGVLGERLVGVTRAPSLAFLEHYLMSPANVIDQQDLFYLVNPTGELTKTETRFQAVVNNKDRKWDGLCGKCSKEEAWSRYSGQRMYMYCGHGTGTQYISPRHFENGKDAPVALLMGCSSAKPVKFEVGRHLSSIDFLVRGSPAAVGTLWDVTDGDIDRFTLSVLSRWTGTSPPGYLSTLCSLSEAVAISRLACRMRYLVGASCVVIGAPGIFVHPNHSQ